MKKTIYILGGEGFIGLNLAEYFGTNKNYKVFLVSKNKSLFPLDDSIPLEKIYCDIYDCNFYIEPNSIIIHLARSGFSNITQFKIKEKKLRDYILSFNPSKIISFSSSVVYTSFESDYKNEKEEFEKIWENYSAIIRLFNTYGKYQLSNRQGSLVSTIFYNYLKGITININDINQLRNFIYAGDIGKVIELVINNNLTGVFDVGNKTITIGKLLEYIGNVIPLKKVNLLNNKEVIFNVEPKDSFEINYTSFEDGLKYTYNFIEKNINKYN